MSEPELPLLHQKTLGGIKQGSIMSDYPYVQKNRNHNVSLDGI